MFRHASEDETTESLPAVGRHYDQLGAQSFRGLKNLDARSAHHDFDFVAGFAIDFLASQPLKLGGSRPDSGGGSCDRIRRRDVSDSNTRKRQCFQWMLREVCFAVSALYAESDFLVIDNSAVHGK